MTAVRIQRTGMSDLSPEQIAEVLESRISAMLSVVDRQGYPRLLPCWFLWDNEAFLVASEADRFHVRCLQRNPQAAICVELADGNLPPQAGQQHRLWQVKGHGDIDILPDPGGAVLDRIRQRYLGAMPLPAAAASAPEPERVILRLKPAKLSAHGATMLFEAVE